MVTRIYANAVARYNEGKLLDGEKLNRLIDAEFSDAVKMLCDYGYGGGTADEKSYDIDAFISRETAALIDYVISSAPNEYVARVLINGFLYGNAKAYYKARVSGKENPAAVFEMQDEEIKAAVYKGDYAALPEPMADALERLDSMFTEQKPNPKTIDIMLSKARFADSIECAKKAKDKSLVKYAVSEIDLSNVLSALRARALGMSEASFAELFIEGGKLDYDEALAVFKADDAVKALQNTEYDFIADNAETLSLPHAEAKTSEYLAEIWERKADDMRSLSPFAGYFLAQMREYKTVKLILACLKNGARSEIYPRLYKGA